jgi:hypothetical protein
MNGTRQNQLDMPTRDHIVPQRLGGKIWIIVCQGCNFDKADLYLNEWVFVLQNRKDPRAQRVNDLMLGLLAGTIRRTNTGVRLAPGVFS